MERNSHYFANDPLSNSRESVIELNLPDLTRPLTTASGVCSNKKIDAGTKFLLLHAPAPDKSPTRVLDLGCGYVPIAALLDHRFPDSLLFSTDVNNRSLRLSTLNLVG